MENVDKRPMPFQAGFHYAFALPLAEGLGTEDHELRFAGAEEPVEILTRAGLVSGSQARFTGADRVALNDHLFDDDSICLSGLRTPWIELGTRMPGPALRLGMADFPYVLLWSKPGPMRFCVFSRGTAFPTARRVTMTCSAARQCVSWTRGSSLPVPRP